MTDRAITDNYLNVLMISSRLNGDQDQLRDHITSLAPFAAWWSQGKRLSMVE